MTHVKVAVNQSFVYEASNQKLYSHSQIVLSFKYQNTFCRLFMVLWKNRFCSNCFGKFIISDKTMTWLVTTDRISQTAWCITTHVKFVRRSSSLYGIVSRCDDTDSNLVDKVVVQFRTVDSTQVYIKVSSLKLFLIFLKDTVLNINLMIWLLKWFVWIRLLNQNVGFRLEMCHNMTESHDQPWIFVSFTVMHISTISLELFQVLQLALIKIFCHIMSFPRQILL